MLLKNIKKDYMQYRKNYKHNWNNRQDEIGKEILSLILSNLKNKEISLNTKWEEVNDTDIIKIIENEIKQIKDTLSYLEKAWKENSVAEEKRKIIILEKYLPQKLTEEELIKIIKDIINENNINDINKGKWIIFKILKERYGGKYDWQIVNTILNSKIIK